MALTSKGYTLPKNFLDMIELHKKRDFLLSNQVVPFEIYKKLKQELDLTRYSCIEFIKKQRGNPGRGSSGAK